MENKNIIFFILIIIFYFMYDDRKNKKELQIIKEHFSDGKDGEINDIINDKIDKYLNDNNRGGKKINITESLKNLSLIAQKLQEKNYLRIPGKFKINGNLISYGNSFSTSIGTIIMWGLNTPPFPNNKDIHTFENIVYDSRIIDVPSVGVKEDYTHFLDVGYNLTYYYIPKEIQPIPTNNFSLNINKDNNNILEIKRIDTGNIGSGWGAEFQIKISLNFMDKNFDYCYWFPCTGKTYRGIKTPNLLNKIPIGAGDWSFGDKNRLKEMGGRLPDYRHNHYNAHVHFFNFNNDNFDEGGSKRGIADDCFGRRCNANVKFTAMARRRGERDWKHTSFTKIGEDQKGIPSDNYNKYSVPTSSVVQYWIRVK